MTASVIAGEIACGPTLHLIDIENLCGGRLSSSRCSSAWEHYLYQVGVSAEDQVTVAANARHAAAAFFCLPQTARRILVPNTPDAADHALLESAQVNRITQRHCSVVIASGDGAFAPLARALRAAGLHVIQVITEGVAVSGDLYLSCEELIRLPALDPPPPHSGNDVVPTAAPRDSRALLHNKFAAGSRSMSAPAPRSRQTRQLCGSILPKLDTRLKLSVSGSKRGDQ